VQVLTVSHNAPRSQHPNKNVCTVVAV